MIRTLDILPNVHIPPRLAQQIKDLSDEETLGFIEGYVSSIRHPKAIELKQIRMTQKVGGVYLKQLLNLIRNLVAATTERKRLGYHCTAGGSIES